MGCEWSNPCCPNCGYPLVETSHPNFAWCSVCGQHVAIHDWLEQPFVISEQYTFLGETQEAQMLPVIFVDENCAYCGQPIQEATDPHVDYCPCCGSLALSRHVQD